MFETFFFEATKGLLYFLTNVYFVKIKNEHRNVHINYFLVEIFQIM